GFKNVFQLEGGILKYFEECGGAHYQGECFVFDQRVGVDPALRETESTQCYKCLAPLTREEQLDVRYVPNQSCPYCFKTFEEGMALTLARRHEAIRKVVTPLPGSQPYDNFRPVSVPEDCHGATLLAVLCRVVKHVPAPEWEKECARGLIVNRDREPMEATYIVKAGERYLHKFPDVVEPDVNGTVTI